MDYKTTLKLPTTDFPMKASLTTKEPETLKFWEERQVYAKLIAKNKQAKRFTLHDGPPYANGSIHLGTSLNKVLKDIVVKYHNLRGFLSEYVPGWDCHGLPIELQVIKELGKKHPSLSTVEFRQECRNYANRFLDVQRSEFKRLGVFGDWQHPYRTMDPSYQAEIIREFGRVVEKGGVFRKKKPVFWCWHCETALAEAEVEYQDHQSPSIYVGFPVKTSPDAALSKFANLAVMIWTTTPWTLVSNLAISVNPEFTYAVVAANGRHYIIAEKLFESVVQATGWRDAKIVKVVPSKNLQGVICQHPFIDRPSPIIFGEHVTLEGGTGCVHTAPGHGQEDYEVGIANGLEVYAPVDPRGRFTAEAGEFAGKHIFAANDQVLEVLQAKGALVAAGKIDHSYPHCWRCKKPVIFRATEQWFIGMETNQLRKNALAAIRQVEWIPKWGVDRINGMLEARPDWCISRQRTWGVPIVTFACTKCGEHQLDVATIRAVAEIVEKHEFGADIWFAKDSTNPGANSIDVLVNGKLACRACGNQQWERGKDILDVWFDSGVSYAAVFEKRLGLKLPCELYLEGSDQHRGWFHSALLEAVATRGNAPYKAVLTHGFVVDGSGKKMSKSLGNYINAVDMVKSRGAELLRLWVGAEDYQNDIRISEEIMSRMTEAYRRIRNTCRFLLGNINDFNPQRDYVAYDKMLEIDRYILARFARLQEQVIKSYDEYSFHQIYHAVHNFCVVDLSSFYLDVSKDCLYTNPANSLARRSAQTALYEIVTHLAPLLAPILSFTAEEIWQYLPEQRPENASWGCKNVESVFLAGITAVDKSWLNSELTDRWQRLIQVRAAVLKVLEAKRAAKVIGSSLEARVIYCYDGGDATLKKLLAQYSHELASHWIVSQADVDESLSKHAEAVAVEDIPGLWLRVDLAHGKKCERCWVMKEDIGADASHPTICGRCSQAVKS